VIAKMNSLQKKNLNKAIGLILTAILEEVEEELNKNSKQMWIREWIKRRDTLGATNGLLRELEFEDPKEYFVTLRMSERCFNF